MAGSSEIESELLSDIEKMKNQKRMSEAAAEVQSGSEEAQSEDDGGKLKAEPLVVCAKSENQQTAVE